MGESCFVVLWEVALLRVSLLPGCCLELPGKDKLTLQVLGNHNLSFPVLVCVGQAAELLGLCFLWQNTELSFPSSLPGCFAGASNLLSQGERGMGAAQGKHFMSGGMGRSPMTDQVQQNKKILQPFRIFFFLPA